MRAPRAAVAAGVFVLAAVLLRAAPQVEADPHDLYERARAHLAEGELKEASATITRLRRLIESRRDWDPEGVFAKHLLPPLQARLDRLLKAGRMLDDFSARALEGAKSPDFEKDISTVHDYTDWTTSVIKRLRDERDGLIAEALKDPEERAILAHTESYQRTERLLQVEILQQLAQSAGNDILGLLGGDPQLESVLVRFRQLKRDLMKASSERDELQKEVMTCRGQTEAALNALLDVVTDGAPPPKGSGRQATGVADRFRRFLDDRRQALEHRAPLQPEERDALLANIDRYRRYNAVLRAAGLGHDESARIEALSKTVSGLPVTRDALATVKTRARVLTLVACGLALATVLLGWLSRARGRRLRPGRIGAREVQDADAGPKAA